MSIGIIDYGACNILSVFNSFYRLGVDPIIIKKPNELKNCDKIVIPGVGSAFNSIKNLKSSGIFEEIKKFNEFEKPIMGICLGFQIFCKNLHEDGLTEGLSFIDADVIKLNIKKKFNIGWCSVEISDIYKKKLNLSKVSNYYFCHSYFLKFNNNIDKEYCVGTHISEVKIPSLYVKDNLIGCQFHPEKSQKSGEEILKYFINI